MTQDSITTPTLIFQHMGKLPVKSRINSFCPTGALDRVAQSPGQNCLGQALEHQVQSSVLS